MIHQYYRPSNIQEALELLSRENTNTGLLLSQSLTDIFPTQAVDEIIDLQAIGYDRIEQDGGTSIIGAFTTIQDVADSPHLPDAIREIARNESNNIFRSMRTVISLIIHDADKSVLVSALRACQATVIVHTLSDTQEIPIDEFIARATDIFSASLPTVITLKSIGTLDYEVVARTPKDKPIVSVVVHQSETGEQQIVVMGADSESQGDFRGSWQYRQAMSQVLTERILNRMGRSSDNHNTLQGRD